MKLLILVVDDEPDVEKLFRQQFRRDLRAGWFNMEFAQSGRATIAGTYTARPFGDGDVPYFVRLNPSFLEGFSLTLD